MLKTSNTSFLACFLVAALCSEGILFAQSQTTITLGGNSTDRIGIPIVFEIPDRLLESKEFKLSLSGKTIPVQRLGRESRQAAFVLPAELNTIENITLRLEPSEGIEVESKSKLVEARANSTSGDLEITSHGKPILSYATSTHKPQAGLPAFYARSGHIHPVMTPSGKIITSEFPKGHTHQHAIFNAWVNTTFEGHPVDFWNQHNRTGNVEHVRVVETVSGDVFGGFTVELQHLDLTKPDAPKQVLREYWTVRVWNRTDGYLFDIESNQTCVADSVLKINEYHYGGMGFRANDQWMGQQGAGFLTSEGKTRVDGNHSRPNWTIAHGAIDKEPCYMAIMGHPSNFRHPEPVRLHPDMPYFVHSPSVLGAFEIAPGEDYVARYRFFVADGKPDRAVVDRIWTGLANPVKVEIGAK